MKMIYITLILLFLSVSIAYAYERNLIVVNSNGETTDFVSLSDSTVNLNTATLGLYPNDVLVIDDYAIVVNSGTNDLLYFNLPEMTAAGSVFLGSNRNPWTGAFLNHDTLVITNFVSSTISVVDVPAQMLINEYPVGDLLDSDSPQGLLIEGSKAYICLTSFNDEFVYDIGKIEVFDLTTFTSEKIIEVGINPQAIKKGYDGYYYIVCTGNYNDIEGWLFKFDPVGDTLVDSLFIGGQPGNLAIIKDGTAFLSAGGWATGAGTIYTVNLNGWTVFNGPTNPLITDGGVVAVKTVSDSTVVSCNFQDDTVTELDKYGNIYNRFNVGDGPTAVGKYPACYVLKGDADASGEIDISDAVYLISFIFGGGNAPVVLGGGDVDCSGAVDISDAVYIISYIFGGGPGSCGCAD